MNSRQLYDHQLEEAWIGTLIQNPRLIPMALTEVATDDLIDRMDLSYVWQSIGEMYQEGLAVDPTSLGNHLKTNKRMSEGDVDSVLMQVLPLGGNSDHFETWTEQLSRLGRLRQAYKLFGDMQSQIDRGADIDEVVSEVSSKLAASGGSKRPSYAGEVAEEMLQELHNRIAAGTITQGLYTGFFEIDEATGGLERDDYFGICARTSNGKTALALQIVRNIMSAYDEGIILFFSLEMSATRLIRRLACSISGVGFQKVRSGDMSEEEFNRVQAAFEILKIWKQRVMILTPQQFPGGVTGDKICNTIKAHALRERVLMTVTDNFNLISYRDRHHLNEISRQFKDTALTTQSPNALLIQLNRGNEKANRPPVLSDIKETGQVEQDLDRALLIDREDIRNSTIPEQWDELGIIPGLATFDLAKNRDGARTTFFQMFQPDTMSFVPIIGGMEEAPMPERASRPPLPGMFV